MHNGIVLQVHAFARWWRMNDPYERQRSSRARNFAQGAARGFYGFDRNTTSPQDYAFPDPTPPRLRRY